MDLINRWVTKARWVGTSLTTTLPAQMCREWNVRGGDPLVTYQMDGVLLILPLAYLGVNGEHRLIKLLRDSTLADPP